MPSVIWDKSIVDLRLSIADCSAPQIVEKSAIENRQPAIVSSGLQET
jgi:hypothetical protein